MRHVGMVKKWVEERGFGFVRPCEVAFDGKYTTTEERDHDVFLHISALQRGGINPEQIVRGTILRFDVEEGRSGKRPAAINVEFVEQPAS